jgi:F0F1-type ATP synthase epsilon subunit
MKFTLTTPTSFYVRGNATKVRVYLRTGIAEIYEQHTDLMGVIDGNLIEVETIDDNKVIKNLFVVQDAIFIVNNIEVEPGQQFTGTSVAIHASEGVKLDEESEENIEQRTEDKRGELRYAWQVWIAKQPEEDRAAFEEALEEWLEKSPGDQSAQFQSELKAEAAALFKRKTIGIKNKSPNSKIYLAKQKLSFLLKTKIIMEKLKL